MRFCQTQGEMRRPARLASALLLVACLLTTQAHAATITPSTTRVSLSPTQTAFTVDLSLDEAAAFAGAEFALALPAGVSLDRVAFLDDAVQQASHTPLVTVDGRTVFGFFSGSNRFSDSVSVARLHFSYQGSADAVIRLDRSKIVAIGADGTTTGDTASPTFSVTLMRLGSDAGGSGGSGSSGGSVAPPTVTVPDTAPPLSDLPLFYDVPASHWAFDAVQTAAGRILFRGTSDTTFSPDMAVTRGMLVTVLHRMEGTPAGGSQPFADVPAGAYFADAVAWAADKGIVRGVRDTAFEPDAPITREQTAAILYRYAQYKGQDTSARVDLNSFSDQSTISAYALEPLSWANARTLITGRTATTLAPHATATRAEAATILVRYQDQSA